MLDPLRIALCAALALFLASCQKGEQKPAEEDKVDTPSTLPTDSPHPKPERPSVPPPADVGAAPADAQKTDNGVAYKVLQPGKADGVTPGPNDTVTVHYDSWTKDGTTIDSTRLRNRPMTLPLGNIPMRGFAEGVQTMTVGEKTRMWIPEALAFENNPRAPQGDVVYEVELLDIVAAPPVPEDVAAPPGDAKKTAKGVFYKVLQPGSGKKKPRAWDKVKTHYSGWTTDGRMFDSSVAKGSEPREFAVNGVIAGWTDALQTMVVGEKKRLWIPEELAYKGQPNRPAGMLVFDVELLEITEMPEPPAVPADVAAPPKDAKKTDRGVYYKVLKKGTGKEKPTATSQVKVHYSGWTTDGNMFDSSVTRGQPITFGLDSVIPGWTDGLQTMVVGEKTRLWIPEELAYQGRPGRPPGMLVFDVELLGIE